MLVEQARRGFEAQVQAAHTELAVMNLQMRLAVEAADSRVAGARTALGKAKAVEEKARNDAGDLRRTPR